MAILLGAQLPAQQALEQLGITGFVFLAVVLDAWSRRIVGWSMAPYLRTELVLDALNMALGQRRPTARIHHSDQGAKTSRAALPKESSRAIRR